jgi:hypothetical protein
MFGDKFDLIAWLSAEPDFVSIWSNYKPIGRIRNYDLYEFEVSLSRGLTIRLSRYWLPADLNSRGFFGIDASEKGQACDDGLSRSSRAWWPRRSTARWCYDGRRETKASGQCRLPRCDRASSRAPSSFSSDREALSLLRRCSATALTSKEQTLARKTKPSTSRCSRIAVPSIPRPKSSPSSQVPPVTSANMHRIVGIATSVFGISTM